MGDYGIHCPCIHCEGGLYTLDKSIYICPMIYRQLSMGNILGQSSQLQLHLMDTTLTFSPYGLRLTTARFHHSSSPLGSAMGYWLRLLELVTFCFSVSMGSSGSCSITSLWVVPWPLGTTPINFMVAVGLGQWVLGLVQLDPLVQWVTLSAEWGTYYSVHTGGPVVVLLTVALRQDIALAQNPAHRQLVLA